MRKGRRKNIFCGIVYSLRFNEFFIIKREHESIIDHSKIENIQQFKKDRENEWEEKDRVWTRMFRVEVSHNIYIRL